VAIEHRAAANFVDWATNVFDAADLGGVLFATSVCFDLSVFELFVPLSAGGTVVVVADVLASAAGAEAGAITLINTVPSAMAELVRSGTVPASVRCVNLAGEALPGPLADQIHAALPGARVYNLYGPTETTTYSTYTLVGRQARVTVGRPIDNTQVYILDARGHLVPPGAAGELYIGGAGLARGYLGRADLTAERFVSWQPPTGPAVRLYRTGDRARWGHDGQLEYLGRLDSQVKLRGFRIELGEIEAQLLRHPAVAAAAVVIREDRPDDRQLVAYVEVAGEGPAPLALQAHLRGTLPDYMVPSRFVLLDRLPYTPNGKIDRKKLPAPEASATEVRPVDRPVGEVETTLAGFWLELLGGSQIGRDDDFFELGGHSLLVVRLVSRIQQRFGLLLPVSVVAEARTIAALAHQIDVLTAVSQAPAPVAGGEREDIEL
jgi:acyl-coenzyme A synthetase/AMP-(fatty) acid ligase/acyl carrier protein